MNVVDITIIGILIISAAISFVRGFVKESLSLVAWILAIWVAVHYAPRLSLLLLEYINSELVRQITAFFALFAVTLFLGSMVNVLIGKLIRKTGLSGTDRMVGIVFGLARGSLVVALVVLLAGITTMPQQMWWHESNLVAPFEKMAYFMRDSFPKDLASNISF
jgi:membrane protein required for colicin V production